jgi:hypothetical protein
MNVLTMGTTTQADVAHYVVWETIWRLNHGCKIFERGHGWGKKNWIYATCLQSMVNCPPSLHYNNLGTCIVLTKFNATCNIMLRDELNAFITTIIMISNHLMEMEKKCMWIKDPISITTPLVTRFTSCTISPPNKPIHRLIIKAKPISLVHYLAMAFWIPQLGSRWVGCWN